MTAPADDTTRREPASAEAMRDVPESFDPTTHPLRDEAERWWCAGYLRQGVVAKSKRGPAPFALFMQGFVAGRETAPAPLPARDDAVEEARSVYVSRGDVEWAARLLSCLPFGATVTGRMADDAVTLAARLDAALRREKGGA